MVVDDIAGTPGSSTNSAVVLIIDSSPISRVGIRGTLQAAYGPILEEESVQAAISSSLPRDQASLIIINSTSLKSELTQGDILDLKAEYPLGRLLVLIDRFLMQNEVLRLLQSGANVLVLPNISGDTLLKVLDLLMSGTTILLGFLCGKIAEPPVAEGPAGPPIENGPRKGNGQLLTPNLSDRERMVLAALADGEPNKIIARTLGIAESTVKVYVKAILRKTCTSNRTQAALWLVTHQQSDMPSEALG